MLSISAVIKVVAGAEITMREALLAVARPILDGEVVLVKANELSAK